MENPPFQNDCPIWPQPISPLASSSSLLQCHEPEQLDQVRGDDCGWDLTEGLSGIARMHISAIQETATNSDVSSQYLSSRHYLEDVLFAENPKVGFPVTTFLHDGHHGHSLETRNFAFRGSSNCRPFNHSYPVINKTVIGRSEEARHVCHSTSDNSDPKDSNFRLDSLTTFQDLWNLKCIDKKFDPQNFDGPFKDCDSISSKCELRLAQPSEQSWTQGSESFKSYQTGAPYEAKGSGLANQLLKLSYSRDTLFLSNMDREGIHSDPKHMPELFSSTNFSSLHGGHSGGISAHHAFLLPVKDPEQHIYPEAATGIIDENHTMVGKKIFEPCIANGDKVVSPSIRDHEIRRVFNDSILFGKKINDKGLRCSLDNCHNAAALNLNCYPLFPEGKNMQMFKAHDLVESCKHNNVYTSTRSIHESQMFKTSCDRTYNFFGSATSGLGKNYDLPDLSQKAEFAKTKSCQHLYDVYPSGQSLLSSSQWRDVPRKMTASRDRCNNNSLIDEGSGISSNCKNGVFSCATLSHETDFHGYRRWEDFEIENQAKRKMYNGTSENFKLLKRKRLHCSVLRSSKVHIGESNSGNSYTGTSSGHQAMFFKQVKPIVCHKYGIISNGGPLKQTRIVSMKNVLIAAKGASITEHHEVQGLLQSKVEGPNDEKVSMCGCRDSHAPVKQSNADDCTSGKKEDFTCSRTEGYKGRECSSSWCSVSHCHDGDYRCHVSQDQLNVWLHIHTHKSFPRGRLDSQKAEFEYDSREQYARFKQSKCWMHLLVYKSIIHGLGLYTSQFIPRGSMVVEYLGEVVGPRVADKRETEYQSRKKIQYKGACYLFKVDKEHIIDGTHKGGIARFVNHSCLPNCVAKVISVRNEKKVVFYADREIYPGEEVTYDYHFKKEDDGEKIPCNCRSRNCRRYLN